MVNPKLFGVIILIAIVLGLYIWYQNYEEKKYTVNETMINGQYRNKPNIRNTTDMNLVKQSNQIDTTALVDNNMNEDYLGYDGKVESDDSIGAKENLPYTDIQFPEASKEVIEQRFKTRDQANPKHYKRINYTYGKRGGNESAALNFIDESNSLMQPGTGTNDNFVGEDETSQQFAKFRPEKKQVDKYKTSEIFNSKYYLPSERSVNDDWFQILPEAISSKNRHLINVSKPIGINTIGTSLRNPSWDLRGTPQCPKFVVSPWMQSTIEPDTNVKSLC